MFKEEMQKLQVSQNKQIEGPKEVWERVRTSCIEAQKGKNVEDENNPFREKEDSDLFEST